MSKERSFTSGIVTRTADYTIQKLWPESARLIFTLRWPHCFVSTLALAHQGSCFRVRGYTTRAFQCLSKEFAQNPEGDGPGEIRVSWV